VVQLGGGDFNQASISHSSGSSLLVHIVWVKTIEIVVNSRRRMNLCMQDDQNGQKMMVLTSAEETRLTCFILFQNIFF
jgi:hypothetical protein